MPSSALVNIKGQLQLPCTDKLPKASSASAGQFSAISLTRAIWAQGQTGTITVTFGSNACADCSDSSAWSQIGNFSDKTEPSMNLGYIDPPFKSFEFKGIKYEVPLRLHRNYCGDFTNFPPACTSDPNEKNCGCDVNWVPGATVVHEFGHALGMMHEHQNNIDGKTPINLNAVSIKKTYEQMYLNSGFSSAEARAKAAADAANNVIDVYSCVGTGTCEFSGTTYDKNSVMLYKFPDSWIEGYGSPGFSNPTQLNFRLSDADKSWLKSKYPLNSNNRPEITIEFIDPNVELWKVKWVEKVVTETFGPLLGINWYFKVRSTVKETSNSSPGSFNGTTVAANTNKTSSGGTSLGSSAIIGISVSVSLLVLMILTILLFWKKQWGLFKKTRG